MNVSSSPSGGWIRMPWLCWLVVYGLRASCVRVKVSFAFFSTHKFHVCWHCEKVLKICRLKTLYPFWLLDCVFLSCVCCDIMVKYLPLLPRLILFVGVLIIIHWNSVLPWSQNFNLFPPPSKDFRIYLQLWDILMPRNEGKRDLIAS